MARQLTGNLKADVWFREAETRLRMLTVRRRWRGADIVRVEIWVQSKFQIMHFFCMTSEMTTAEAKSLRALQAGYAILCFADMRIR